MSTLRRTTPLQKGPLAERYTQMKEQGKKSEDMFKDFEFGWRNNGVLRDGSEFSMQEAALVTGNREFADALNAADMAAWIPRVINTIVREAVEPILVGEKLLTKIQFKPGQLIELGTMGAISGDFEVSDMGEINEVKIQIGDGTMIRGTGRSALALRFAPDIINYSIYPAMEIHVKAGARALARYKEEKIFDHILNVGQVVKDNVTPANAVDPAHGITTGRDFLGNANGSIRAEDFMDLFIQVMRQGFMPNTILMHTLCWMMFMKDPVLKYMAINSGGGTFWGSYTGNPIARNDWPNMNGRGIGAGQFAVPPGATGAMPDWAYPPTDARPVFPAYFWGTPVNIIVSPFVPFDETNNRTSIIVFDSNELGYLVTERELQTRDWTDPNTEIYSVVLDEKYHIQIANEGQGIAVANNVQVTPGNEIVTPAQATIAVSGSNLTEIDESTSPYGAGS